MTEYIYNITSFPAAKSLSDPSSEPAQVYTSRFLATPEILEEQLISAIRRFFAECPQKPTKLEIICLGSYLGEKEGKRVQERADLT